MIESPRIDDEIIYSWCFNFVKYFDSTPSSAIIILDEDLEGISSLRSQQERPQLKVPIEALWEFSSFFSFSLGEEF